MFENLVVVEVPVFFLYSPHQLATVVEVELYLYHEKFFFAPPPFCQAVKYGNNWGSDTDSHTLQVLIFMKILQSLTSLTSSSIVAVTIFSSTVVMVSGSDAVNKYKYNNHTWNEIKIFIPLPSVSLLLIEVESSSISRGTWEVRLSFNKHE